MATEPYTATFTVPGIPVAQPRPRVYRNPRTGRSVTVSDSRAVKAYKNAIILVGKMHVDYGHRLVRSLYEFQLGSVTVEAVIVFPRPQRLTWKNKPMPRLPHTSKPDADNVLKAILDALAPAVIPDDRFVAATSIQAFIAAGDEKPHTKIKITWKP